MELCITFHVAYSKLGQQYWSGLPWPPPRDLPNSGVKLRSLHCRWILYEWTRRRVFTAHSPEPGGRPGSADTCWRPGDPSPRVSTQHRACGCLLIKRTALLGGRGSPLDSETCQLALSLYSDSCPETGVPKAWQERRGRDSEPMGCVQGAIP